MGMVTDDKSDGQQSPLNLKLSAQMSLQILKTLIKVTEETPDVKNQLTFLNAAQKMLNILSSEEILSLTQAQDDSTNMDTTNDSSINESNVLTSLAETLNKCCNLDEEDFRNLLKTDEKDKVARSKRASE